MTNQNRFTTSPGAATDGNTDGPTTAEVFQNLRSLAIELLDYGRYYLSARLDKVKWSLTKVGMLAAIGLIALLALSGAVVAGVVILLIGLANGVAALFADELAWIGWLITGGLILAVMGGGALLGMAILQRGAARRMEQKYESKRQRQQSEYGHNVRSRAAGSSQPVKPS